MKVESPNLGYIDIDFPAELAKGNFRADTMHLFPRKGFFMIGFPNEDDSISTNVLYNLRGKDSFESFKTNEQFAEFYKSNFPECVKCVPNIDTIWEGLRISYLQDYSCVSFAYGKACLVGDAAHTI
jgi:kynurenine 3-monooxygenase